MEVYQQWGVGNNVLLRKISDWSLLWSAGTTMTSNFQFISLKDVYGIDTKSLAEFIRRGAASTENDENVSTNNIEDVFDKN